MSSDTHNDELSRLVSGALDDAAAGDSAALAKLLEAGGDEAIERYLDVVAVHTFLRRQMGAMRVMPGGASEAAARVEPIGRIVRWRGPLLIAAAVLIVGAAVAIYLAMVTPTTPDGPVVLEVASVTHTEHAVWSADSEALSAGDAAPAGTYGLERGSAELLLSSSVSLSMWGPGRYTIDGPMRVGVSGGWLDIAAPHSAKGFTVNAPGGVKVVDLGTVFTVHVGDDGSTAVYVREGSVELHAPNGEPIVVTAGAGYRVVSGERPVAVDSELVAAALDPAARARSAYEAMVMADQPAAYWPLTAGVGDATRELVGGVSGAAVGVAFDAAGPLTGETVARFDGRSHIDLGDRGDLLFDGPFTVEAWVWIDPSMIGHGRVISFDSGEGGGWALGVTPTPDRRGLPVGVLYTLLGVRDFRFPQAPAVGRWTHLAVVVDASRDVSVYIDGRLAGDAQSGLKPRAPRSPRLLIGQQSANSEPFAGRIAHVAVYDRALSSAQIADHAQTGESP